MDLIARFDALHRPELCSFLAWITHLETAHGIRQRLLEGFEHRAQNDEALARDATLAAVHHARRCRDLGSGRNVGIVEHEVGVGAAELEHGLLEHRSGRGRNAPSCGDTAGEGHGRDIFVPDQGLDVAASNEQAAEQIPRDTRFVKHLLDGERTARDVTGMLQERPVARHQRRRGETEQLPEGKIPRHHREDDSDRIEGDEGFSLTRVDRLVREIAFRMIGKPVAIECAFLDFGPSLIERLAHLLCHQGRKFVLAGAQDFSGLPDNRRALGEACPTPFEEGLACGGRRSVCVLDRMLVVRSARLARRRIHGLHLFAGLVARKFGLLSHGDPPIC